MTSAKQRISSFSSGMSKLCEDDRHRIHKLACALFWVEQYSINPIFQKTNCGLGKYNELTEYVKRRFS